MTRAIERSITAASKTCSLCMMRSSIIRQCIIALQAHGRCATRICSTLSRLLAHNLATKRKAIVWAHNSHVGDARYTAMGSRRNEVNLAQLCRERLGRENVAIIGCGTHTGTVAAAHTGMKIWRLWRFVRQGTTAGRWWLAQLVYRVFYLIFATVVSTLVCEPQCLRRTASNASSA